MKKLLRFSISITLILASFTVIADKNLAIYLSELPQTSTLQQTLADHEHAYNKNNDSQIAAESYAASLHQMASRPGEHEIEATVQLLENLAHKFPSSQLIQAYTGSATTMSARDVWFIPSKISRVNKGIEILDKAVDVSDSNPHVLLIRANNSLKLPERFDRRSLAVEDLNNALRKPALYDKDTKLRILAQLIVLYEDTGNNSLQAQLWNNFKNSNPAPELLAKVGEHLLP